MITINNPQRFITGAALAATAAFFLWLAVWNYGFGWYSYLLLPKMLGYTGCILFFLLMAFAAGVALFLPLLRYFQSKKIESLRGTALWILVGATLLYVPAVFYATYTIYYASAKASFEHEMQTYGELTTIKVYKVEYYTTTDRSKNTTKQCSVTFSYEVDGQVYSTSVKKTPEDCMNFSEGMTFGSMVSKRYPTVFDPDNLQAAPLPFIHFQF